MCGCLHDDDPPMLRLLLLGPHRRRADYIVPESSRGSLLQPCWALRAPTVLDGTSSTVLPPVLPPCEVRCLPYMFLSSAKPQEMIEHPWSSSVCSCSTCHNRTTPAHCEAVLLRPR